MDALVKISDVSKNFGLTTRTLRYYEEIGLIESHRSEEYAYRMYDETNLKRLQEIVVLRKLDISIKNIILIYEEDNYDLLKTVIRHKLDEMDEQAKTLTELKELVALFLKNIEENRSILSGMELAEKSAGRRQENQSETFDLTRFVELCDQVGTKHEFMVVRLGSFDFNFPLNEEENRFGKNQDCYYVFDSERNCFGEAVLTEEKGKNEYLYAVTVARGEAKFSSALLSFGNWLKNSPYIRAKGQKFCLIKNMGGVETDDGPMEQLAIFLPITLLNAKGNPALKKVQLTTIKNKLMEGFKMFNSKLETAEIRSFSSAQPMAELGLFALPECRVIGKSIELPMNFKENPIPDMWKKMFQNGDFEQLVKLPRYRRDMYVGLSDCKNSDSGKFVYYAGVLCSPDTTPPAGFTYVDLNSTLTVLGRFGEDVFKVHKGIKKMGLEVGYNQGAGTAWDMEIYYESECHGPAAGKNYGSNTWRMLVPACKKVNKK